MTSFTAPGTTRPLRHRGEDLVDDVNGTVYPILDGIPVLLPGDLDEVKRQLIQFWGSCPNGSLDAGTLPDDPAFFERADAARMRVHTDLGLPWYMGAIDFDRHRGQEVLEVGCGIGGDTVRWAERGNAVCAIDLNLPSVSLTRQALLRRGLSATLAVADAENIPFPDNSFDLVYSFGVLHHSPDCARGVRETMRVLRPGGELILMLYHRQSVLYQWRVRFWLGLVRGYRKRFRDSTALLSHFTEDQAKGSELNNPLTRAFTRNEVTAMLGGMRDVNIEAHYIDVSQLIPPVPPYRLWRALAHALQRLLPVRAKRVICARWGWNLIVHATK